MKITKTTVTIPSEPYTLSGTLFQPESKSPLPAVLCLHGGGTATGKLYHQWQEVLARHGFASLSFDFRGVGGSEGTFAEGSLNNRLIDAQHALEFLKQMHDIDSERIVIMANSMGGHVAVQLIDQNPTLPALILGCTAAYAEEAEDKPLTDAFTQILRKKDSWKSSRNFAMLQRFAGKVLVFYGEHEDIIPKALQEQIITIASAKGEVHVLPHMGHRLLTVFNEQQAQSQQGMFAQSITFLNKTL